MDLKKLYHLGELELNLPCITNQGFMVSTTIRLDREFSEISHTSLQVLSILALNAKPFSSDTQLPNRNCSAHATISPNFEKIESLRRAPEYV